MRIRFAGLGVALAIATIVVRASAAAEEPAVLTHCLVSLIEEAQVPAQEAGVVVNLKVREGQAITKGELLVQMDDAIAQAERDKAKGEMEAANIKATSDVDIEYATKASLVAYYTWQKNEEANRKVPGSISTVEVKRLELDYQRAVLQIRQAKLEQKIAEETAKAKAAEVSAATEAIAHRQIKSPLAGIVVQVIPHQGEWVKPGDTVIRVVRMDRLRVEGFLNSSKYAPHDIRDRKVIVTVALHNHLEPVQFSGRIVFVSPLDEQGLGGTSEYRVWAEVDNRIVAGRTDDWLLRPGATATMTIDTSGPVAKLGSRD